MTIEEFKAQCLIRAADHYGCEAVIWWSDDACYFCHVRTDNGDAEYRLVDGAIEATYL